MRNKITITFATPAVLLDFTSFLYRVSFLSDYKLNSDLIRHFERTGTFTVSAGVRSWSRLFMYLETLDESYFNNRYGMLIFSIYVSLRNLPEFAFLQITDRLENDPFFEKKKLFESCMNGITNFE